MSSFSILIATKCHLEHLKPITNSFVLKTAAARAEHNATVYYHTIYLAVDSRHCLPVLQNSLRMLT